MGSRSSRIRRLGATDARLLGAVDRLSGDRRVVVLLRYGLDLTPSEIAETLGLPVGTVKSRLARALDELRSNWR